MTLDAAAQRIDRPRAWAPLGTIVCGISFLRDVTLQSCFIDGVVSNVGQESVAEWADLIGELRLAETGDVVIAERIDRTQAGDKSV